MRERILYCSPFFNHKQHASSGNMTVIYGLQSNNILLRCLGLFVISVPVFPHEDNLKDFCTPPMNIHGGTFKPNRERYRVGEKVIYQCDSSIIYRFGENSVECVGNEEWKGTVPYCAFPEDINSVLHDNKNQKALIDRNHEQCATSGVKDSWHISTKENFSGHVVIKIIVKDLSSGSSNTDKQLQAKTEEGICSHNSTVPAGRKRFSTDFDCEVRKQTSQFEIVPTYHYNYQIELCEIYIYRKKSFSCSSNIKIPNGNVRSPNNASKIGYGESITFSCNEGYRLEGRRYLRCKDGIFDSPPPNCQPVSCANAPPVVTNGEWHEWNVSHHYFYGNYLVASCESGYVINNGINFTQCQNDGSWSGKDVACLQEEIKASLLVPIVATVMTFVIVIVGLIVTCILCSKRRNTENSKSRNSEHIYNEPTYYSSVNNVQQHKLSPPNPPLKTHPLYSDPLDKHYSIDDEGCYYEPYSLRKCDQAQDVFQNVDKNNPVYVCSEEDERIQDSSENKGRNLDENIPKNDISVENELYGSD